MRKREEAWFRGYKIANLLYAYCPTMATSDKRRLEQIIGQDILDAEKLIVVKAIRIAKACDRNHSRQSCYVSADIVENLQTYAKGLK